MARRTAMLVLGLALASPAAAQISAELRAVPPDGQALLLAWVAAGGDSGPFHLLKRTLAPGERVADNWPLDAVDDLYLPDVSSPLPLYRADEIADGEGLRVYALVSESGACSNASYVIVHDPTADWDQDAPHHWGEVWVGMPWRGGGRTFADLLAANPHLVGAFTGSRERGWRTYRQPDGSWNPPVEGFVSAGMAVGLAFSAHEPIVLVGSSDPSARPVRAGGWTGSRETEQSAISLRMGSTALDSRELLCGRFGIDWDDADGDGCPDQCAGGIIQDSSDGRVMNWWNLSPFAVQEIWVEDGEPGCLDFGLAPPLWFSIDPTKGYIESSHGAGGFERQDEPNEWLPDDAAAPAACRCPDRDGDGTDDCSEMLHGTDPDDPLSRGPDHDADGVPDDLDLCPATADPAQGDADADGRGDACDPCPNGDPACEDVDGDGEDLYRDNCPSLFNPDQADEDLDGLGDLCDPCPSVYDYAHVDSDGDGTPDLCDCEPDGMTDATPPAHAELRLFREPSFSRNRVGLDWTEAHRYFGPSLYWDVAVGDLQEAWQTGFAASASCLDEATNRERIERSANGDAWFLVRGRNSCGIGPWGPPAHDSELEAASPCP